MALKFESEKEFEDFLMDNQDFLEESFGCEGYTFYRQLNLGAYGIADIVAINAFRDPDGATYGNIDIFELKNTTLSHVHISQLARYRQFFLQFGGLFSHISVHCHLIGLPTFPGGDDLVFLAQSINWLSVYELGINPRQGLEFNAVSGWKVSKDNTDAVARVRTLLEVPPALAPTMAANESAH